MPYPVRGLPQHYNPKSEHFHANQINEALSHRNQFQHENGPRLGNTEFLKQCDEFLNGDPNGYVKFFANAQNYSNSKPMAGQMESLSENCNPMMQPNAMKSSFEQSRFQGFPQRQSQSQISATNSFASPPPIFSEGSAHNLMSFEQSILPSRCGGSLANFELINNQATATFQNGKAGGNCAGTNLNSFSQKNLKQGAQNHSGLKSQNPKAKKEKLSPKVEGLLQEIEKNDMNSISLLNEVSGKLKKKVDYSIQESSIGRTKIFDCTCVLDNQVIGTKRGNSKQNAKIEAAKEGIKTILSSEKYLSESAAIILSIQKANEKALKQDNFNKSMESTTHSVQSKLSCELELNLSETMSQEKDQVSTACTIKDDLSAFKLNSSSHQEKEAQHHRSALYELNIFSRKFSAEPLWSFPFEANEDGDFEVTLQFGNLVVQEKGKRKQDAKKEAAAKMVQKIKETQTKNEPIIFESNPMLILSKNGFGLKKEDKARDLFNKTRKAGFMAKIQSQKLFEKKEIENRFEAHVSSILKQLEPETSVNEEIQTFFQKIVNYTSITTSNPKQIMLNSENHLADNIRDCYLTPIGSFALGCMRNDNLVVDSLLVYNKMTEISEEELLKLYRHSLETCYELDKEAGTNTTNMEFKFETQGSFLEVTEIKKSNGSFKMRVYISEQSVFQVGHIKDLYKSLDQSVEQLSAFRNLAKMFKIWKRRNSSLACIPSEIIDMVLLNTFLTKKSATIEENVSKTLAVLSSEELIKSILSKFAQSYQNVYESVPVESRLNLRKAAVESGASIVEKNFVDGQIF